MTQNQISGWIDREIQPTLSRLATMRPAVVLTGPRQSGKTSLLRHCFPDAAYLSLELPTVADRATHAGDALLDELGTPVILDEVQYAPEILRHVKARVDQHRQESGRFLMTGSQKFPLMAGVTESLAGRTAVIDCHTLSMREIVAHTRVPVGPTTVLDVILRGGYPELYERPLEAPLFYGDYLATYLERDVRQLINVRNLRDFERCVRLCAVRSGQTITVSSLAGDLGVAGGTVREWLNVLEASNVIAFVEPYFENFGKRIVRSPKLYFLDTGLCCFLAGITTSALLRQSPLLGHMFETFCYGQIIRWLGNRALKMPVHYFRDQHGGEVDFVLPIAGKLLLVECKWTDVDAAQAGFRMLTKSTGESRIAGRAVLNSGADVYVRDGVTIDNPMDLACLGLLAETQSVLDA